MPAGIISADIEDVEIIDAAELASDGATAYSTGVTVVSTTSSTKRVVFSGVDLIYDKDQRAEAGDTLVLSGTSGGLGDGTYTIGSVVDSVTVDVVESLADSSGGSADFIHPSGALKVGIDPTSLVNSTATTVQEAFKDFDTAIENCVEIGQHGALRHLIHFIETNSPGDGFGAGPYASEVVYANNIFPVSETWYETEADKEAGTGKICRWEATYNGNKTFATETWIVYQTDGLSPAAQAVDTISYSGVLETGRSREITVY